MTLQQSKPLERRHSLAHGKSLSKVIEQYLSYVTQDELPPAEITEEVARLSDRLPASLLERDLKHEYLSEKYLRDYRLSRHRRHLDLFIEREPHHLRSTRSKVCVILCASFH